MGVRRETDGAEWAICDWNDTVCLVGKYESAQPGAE